MLPLEPRVASPSDSVIQQPAPLTSARVATRLASLDCPGSRAAHPKRSAYQLDIICMI